LEEDKIENFLIHPKIYSSQFWLLCISSLLFFASFNMLIPELPEYLSSLGGAEYKGLIISLFTLTAMLSRPFSGKLADKIGRVPVIMVGSAVCFGCSLVYPLVTTVAGFLLLRLIHGFSTGFTPTGTAAYLSDVIPAERRGEAMGLFGTAGSLGMAGGPALGGTLDNHFGLDAVFYCSSAMGLISVLILMGIKETLHEKHKYGIGLLKVSREDLFEPRVLAPCIVMVFLGFSYGTSFTLIPDFGRFVGIKNKGLLFTYMTVAALFIRLIGGKASDRYGRQPVLMVCAFFILVSMLVIGFAETQLQLIVGVTLYGLAHGTSSPTLIAWATDLSDHRFRGRGVASVYIFMEFGIGIGAFLSGLLYANDSGRFSLVFGICAAFAGGAFLYLLTKSKMVRDTTA
jgi:MFS family permease